MTVAEFKAWLDGYMTAGGQDMELVREKAMGVDAHPSKAPSPVVVPSPILTEPYIPHSVCVER